MKTNGESKLSFLLMGLGLTAIGGLVAALLARKETGTCCATAPKASSQKASNL